MLGKNQILGKQIKDGKPGKNMSEYVKLEINIMKDLKHPHTVGINYVTNSKDAIFISMPFSRGGDL